MAPTRLQQIVDSHRAAAEHDSRSLSELIAQAQTTPAPRKWQAALEVPGLSVIAEIKRRSPSMGNLSPDLDPIDMASQYARRRRSVFVSAHRC